MQERFDFTLNGLKRLLEKDGVNSKGVLKNALKNAKTIDLKKLKDSIQVEINYRKSKGEEQK